MKKNIESIYPLSPMQQGMLFHTLHEPQAGMYFEQFSCTLKGALDTSALRGACQKVMEHHPVLRTAFVWENPTRPLQVVFREVTLPWVELDWRAIPASEHAMRLSEWMLNDQQQGFDLARPPLMRMTLIRLSDDTYRFIWSHHHMLLDGWSLPIVLKEMFSCYEVLRCGETPALTPSRPYKDYITWLQRQDMAEAEAFWKRALKDFAPPTLLAETIGRRSDAIPTYAEQQFHLPIETTAQLEHLARQQRLTLNTLVQAAWAVVLGRYCNRSDVAFGVTVSGRPAELAGIETMVGLFINTLPLRLHLNPDCALTDWLIDLQERQAEMRRYEYSPLAQIQSWSPVPRGLPLFDSLLVFENYPLENAFQDPRLSLRVFDIRGSERTNYPLTVVAIPRAVEQQQSGLLLKMNFNSRRFDDATIEQLARHLRHVLRGIAEQPDARLGDLELLDETERCQMLVEWNKTVRSFGEPACLHRLFEQQARCAPKAIALREIHDQSAADNDREESTSDPLPPDNLQEPLRRAMQFSVEELSYGELDMRANQLANYLRRLGVGPEMRVAICAQKTISTIVGMLGVLKAGGAFTPLDPDSPVERLAFMVQDSGAAVLLTHAPLVHRLPSFHGTLVRLDEDWPAIAQESAASPDSGVLPENLAYVIYTSGSTGRPKGVMVEHRSI